jgi:hypothetical protein
MSKETAKIMSWLYLVEMSSQTQEPDDRQRPGLPAPAQEMARQTGLESLARYYFEAREKVAPDY